MNLDPGGLVVRCPGELRYPSELAVVHREDRPGLPRWHRSAVPGTRRQAHPALFLAYPLERRPRLAPIERLRGGFASSTRRRDRHQFQQLGRQLQRLVAQVHRRGGVALQHSKHVLGLERWADAPADRLRTVGYDCPQLQAKWLDGL